MKATKLTIIVLSAAAAVIVGGCSNDNSLLGPGTDLQSGPAVNQANRVDIDSNESKPEPEYRIIVAKVERIDVENGCFYLHADDGKTYTPVTPKDLDLESGLKLKAEGYIDNSIDFFCGNGPAFVIENYEVLGKPKMGDNDRDSGIVTESRPSNDEYVDNEMTEERAPSKADEDRFSGNELMDRERDLKEKYKGDYRPYEPPNEEVTPRTNDDNNDRQLVPSEDRPSDDRYTDREREIKKKIEEEQRRKNENNERP